MNESAAVPNWEWLRHYHKCALVIAWMLGSVAVCCVLAALLLLFGQHAHGMKIRLLTQTGLLAPLHMLLTALILVGIAQHLRFLLEPDYRPGKAFHHLPALCTAYALLTLVSWAVWTAHHTCLNVQHPRMGQATWYDVLIRTLLLQSVADFFPTALLFFLLAYVARSVRPVIEESRTLV